MIINVYFHINCSKNMSIIVAVTETKFLLAKIDRTCYKPNKNQLLCLEPSN